MRHDGDGVGDRWHTDGNDVPTRVIHIDCADQVRGELRCAAYDGLLDAHAVAFDRRPEDKGLDLYPVPLSMMAWGDRWLPTERPSVRLTHLVCGQRLTARLSCSACARPIDRSAVTFEDR